MDKDQMNTSAKRSRSVAVTLSLAAVAIIAVMLGAFAIGVAQFNHNLMEEKVIAQVQQQTNLVKAMLTSFDASLRGESARLLKSLETLFPQPFSLKPGEVVQVQGRATPALYNGEQRLNLDTARLEAFSASSGAAATIFVRSGNEFIRIATTLANEKGERAIGTALAANHPAMAKLLAGESYLGLARLFGRDYMTAYSPIEDSQRQVVGVLFVGLDVGAGIKRMKVRFWP